MKKTTFYLGIGLAASCFAMAEDEIMSSSTISTLECPPLSGGYNEALFRNHCAPTGLYATGSFLYWRASGDYLVQGFLNNSFSPNPSDNANLLFNGKCIEPEFAYKPGFQVGLGYKLDRDQWDVYAAYTQFHQKVNHSTRIANETQHIYPVWLTFVNQILLANTFRQVSSEWSTDFDILDIELGREFFCGQYYILRPSLALRNLWLEQQYNLQYISHAESFLVTSRNRTSAWGIGPRFALSNEWCCGWGLKLLGDLGLSLLHVQEGVLAKQTNPVLNGVNDNISYLNRDKMTTLKSILELSLGLSWEHSFSEDRYGFEIGIGYDYAIYYNQGAVQLGHAPLVAPSGPSSQAIVGRTAENVGALALEGLTVKARFDF